MRDRGKREVEAYNNNEEYYGGENMPEFPCKKHPASASSSAGGICAYCLTDRLAQLVCPQCGEQRLSSSCACSCASEIFSNSMTNNTSNTSDVGRISFLLENDQRGAAEISGSKPRLSNYSNYSNNNDEFNANLRRSSSISAAATADVMSKGKKSSETGKLWKIGRLFRKKKDKSNSSKNNNKSGSNNNNNNNNEENYECNGVSRSRSLCSFRGFYEGEESGGIPGSISAARASSVSTGNFMLDSAKRSCFSESEARISNFDYYDASNFVGNKNNMYNNNNNIFSLKETEFVSCDDPAFIDLKLSESNNNNNNNNTNYNYTNYNYSSGSSNMMGSSDYGYNNYNYNYSSRAPDLAAMRRSGLGLSTREYGYRGGGGGGGGHDFMGHHEMLKNGGGSCRISDVSERDLRKCRKSYKVWKWFSKPPHSSTSSKFDDHDFKS